MNFCLEYAHSMHLDAGDCCFYRNTLWHCGVYNSAQPRATLHDIVDTPEYLAFRQEMDILGNGGERKVPAAAVAAYSAKGELPWGAAEMAKL